MFKKRLDEKELMDDLTLNPSILKQNLDELAFLNRWIGSKKALLHAMNTLYNDKPELFKREKIRVVDIGCGSGDLLQVLSQWQMKKNITLDLTGIDVNPVTIQYALEKSQKNSQLQFKNIDIFSAEFSTLQFDIIIINNFCHHFDDATLLSLLQQLKTQARYALIINDLQRHCLSYFAIKLITKLFNFSFSAKNDGPLSVLRAFHKKEWLLILKKLSCKHFKIRWFWAFRWLIIINLTKE